MYGYNRPKPQPKPYFRLRPEKGGDDMQFLLLVNSQNQDGFKLSVKSDNENELKVAQELTEKLIEKITKIEVTVRNEEYE